MLVVTALLCAFFSFAHLASAAHRHFPFCQEGMWLMAQSDIPSGPGRQTNEPPGEFRRDWSDKELSDFAQRTFRFGKRVAEALVSRPEFRTPFSHIASVYSWLPSPLGRSSLHNLLLLREKHLTPFYRAVEEQIRLTTLTASHSDYEKHLQSLYESLALPTLSQFVGHIPSQPHLSSDQLTPESLPILAQVLKDMPLVWGLPNAQHSFFKFQTLLWDLRTMRTHLKISTEKFARRGNFQPSQLIAPERIKVLRRSLTRLVREMGCGNFLANLEPDEAITVILSLLVEKQLAITLLLDRNDPLSSEPPSVKATEETAQNTVSNFEASTLAFLSARDSSINATPNAREPLESAKKPLAAPLVAKIQAQMLTSIVNFVRNLDGISVPQSLFLTGVHFGMFDLALEAIESQGEDSASALSPLITHAQNRLFAMANALREEIVKGNPPQSTSRARAPLLPPDGKAPPLTRAPRQLTRAERMEAYAKAKQPIPQLALNETLKTAQDHHQLAQAQQAWEAIQEDLGRIFTQHALSETDGQSIAETLHAFPLSTRLKIAEALLVLGNTQGGSNPLKALSPYGRLHRLSKDLPLFSLAVDLEADSSKSHKPKALLFFACDTNWGNLVLLLKHVSTTEEERAAGKEAQKFWDQIR